MLSVNQLYGEVDNLAFFVHPVYQRRFEFLSDEKVFESAQKIAAKIERSDYRNVVVSETGARPLAYLCERLLEQSGTRVQWTYMKFPREPKRGIQPLVNFYLTEEERKEKVQGKTREEVLKEIGTTMPASALLSKRKPLSQILQELERNEQNEWQRKIAASVEGTRIADTLQQPFLFFDEYIDSGTTLQNSQQYFNCFARDLNFKTLSYFINIGASNQFERIFSSEFDLDTQLECYSRGAYPFENRIDLIGHYYFIDSDSYLKRSLEEVVQIFKGKIKSDPSNLLQDLNAVIKRRNLLGIVKEQAKIPAVAQFLDENQVVRYYISALEEATGSDGPSNEFLWQLFEMYGPIWSPLPDECHLDFLQAFEERRNQLKAIPEFEKIKLEYKRSRSAVLVQAAEAALERKNSWLARVEHLLEQNKLGGKEK